DPVTLGVKQDRIGQPGLRAPSALLDATRARTPGGAGPRRSGGCHSGVGGRALGLRAVTATTVAATTAVPRAALATLLALTVTGGGGAESAAGACSSPVSPSARTAASDSLPRGSISLSSTCTFWPTDRTSS